MKKYWWKILSIIILLYVLIAGLVVPLRPGVVDVSPGRAVAGELVVLNVEGYNTHFSTRPETIRAWLKWDDTYAIRSNQVLVRNDRRLRASFHLPDHFPVTRMVHELTLILDAPADGAFVMPSALYVREEGGNPEQGKVAWSQSPVSDLHTIGAMRYPFRNILEETIRNVYFHVPMWFGMIILFAASAWFGYSYTRTQKADDDLKSVSFANAGVIFGILGLITGMVWARYTWGAFWSWDIKQNVSAIALLIYLAYFVLRASFDDPERRARLSSGYNVFAFIMLIPLLFIVPRMTDSLHPGSGGNPALGGEDLDNTMRMVFYPAVIGWTLLGVWIAQIWYRFARLKTRTMSSPSMR